MKKPKNRWKTAISMVLLVAISIVISVTISNQESSDFAQANQIHLVSFTDSEWEMVKTLSPPPPIPPSPTNKYADNPKAAELGQMLFFDTNADGINAVDEPDIGWGPVGQPVKMGCAGCHIPSEGFVDRRLGLDWPVSLGADGFTPRRTQPLYNMAYYNPIGFDSDAHRDTLWHQAVKAYEFKLQQNGSRLRLAHVIWDLYKDDYEAVFGPLPAGLGNGSFPPQGKPGTPEWDKLSPADQDAITEVMVNYGKAIAAYERKLNTGLTPFDAFVAGDRQAISRNAQKGLKLFIGKAQCITCHSGPMFTDNQLHVTGVPQKGIHVPKVDTGVLQGIPSLLGSDFLGNSKWSDDPEFGQKLVDFWEAIDQDPVTKEKTRGQFRTAQLRNVAITGPYFHSGFSETLFEAIQIYNHPGVNPNFSGELSPLMRPLDLDHREIKDLVAFLETLTGAVPPELLEDTSRQY